MKTRVLLAEVDEPAAQLMHDLLGKIGNTEVDHVRNGQDAVLRALNAEEPFDVALVDWNMPGKDGLAVLKAIRAAGCQTPVIMVTAESREARVREAIAAGVADYFVKPLQTGPFLRRMADIRTLAELRQLGSQFRVRHVMNANPVTIGPNATVAEAIGLVLEKQVSGLPVVDDGRRLLGDISEFQLVQVVCRPELCDESVEGLMTRDLHVVSESTLLSSVAGMILKERIRRVPVVRDGLLVGIVARRDILRYAAGHQDALRELAAAVRSFLSDSSGSPGLPARGFVPECQPTATALVS